MNGDTFFNVDLDEIYGQHRLHPASIALALKPMEHFDRYGNVRVNGNLIVDFEEKKHCDKGVINGATFKIEDDEKSGGYTVTVVGYPGVFTNWHTATTEDYEWIRIQKLSGADDRTKIAPVINNKYSKPKDT